MPPGSETGGLLAGAALLAALASQQAVAPAPERVPFRILDNVEGPWINLNAVPVRPLAHDALSGDGFALNTHHSSVVRFDSAGEPVRTIRTPWSPVAVGLWEGKLLVVCQGTHALATYDADTGVLERLLELPPEPNDLLVDPLTDTAYISTSGRDVVVQVDLAAGRIAAEYPVDSKRAQFLSMDAAGDVYVAPMLSGNNTSPEYGSKPRRAGQRVLDLSDPSVALTGLPDHDLFRIRPAEGTIEPAARGMGTVLYAHGFHPVTGDLWQLGTDAINADPDRQTEAALRGAFSRNVLAIATLSKRAEPGRSPLAEPHTLRDLDAPSYDPERTIGTPSALAFSAAGEAFVTGLLTDNVTRLDAAGRPLEEFDLAAGAIPRGIVLVDGDRRALVHCWGNNTVELWELSRPARRLAIVPLGFDPAPPLVQRGRELFYDGHTSLNNNASCSTCHVEGRTDMLTWNLSEGPMDDKGPLFTQNLAGIDKLAPFHWRGERATLADFQVAFGGLLGGPGPLDATPGGDFDAFEAFVLSIQARANPHQDRERLVSARVQPSRVPAVLAPANAVRGQELYFTAAAVEANSCDECHALPTGTNHDLFADDTEGQLPKRSTFKVAAFNELWRKEQRIVEPEVLNEAGEVRLPRERALLGAGLTHGGRGPDLFRFMKRFGFSAQETIDVTAFVHQIDQGLAPAVHVGVHLIDADLLDGDRLDGDRLDGKQAAAVELREFLLPQARARHCDLAVLGFHPGAPNWSYDREADRFRADEERLEPRTLADFLGARGENYLFLGLPVGMAEGFAVDFDSDGLLNRDEASHGALALISDSDGDGYPDGHEVRHGADPGDRLDGPVDRRPPAIRNLKLLWTTTTTARLVWETDEPTVYRIDYRGGRHRAGRHRGSVPAEGLSATFTRSHTALIHGLWPSTNPSPTMRYELTLRAVDHGGNATEQVLPGGIETRQFIERLNNERSPETFVSAFDWSVEARGQAALADAVVHVRYRQGGPPAIPAPNYTVIARVFVDGEPSSAWRPRDSTRAEDFTVVNRTGGFEQPGLEPGYSTGPYLITAPTDASGAAQLGFELGGLVRGQRVSLVLEAVLPISNTEAFAASLASCDGCASLPIPVLWPLRDLTRWVLSTTPPEARRLEATVGELPEPDRAPELAAPIEAGAPRASSH